MRKKKWISNYIDNLNQEQVPGKELWAEEEGRELTDAIKTLKSLEEPAFPKEGLDEKLSTSRRKRLAPVFLGVAATAAVFFGGFYLKDLLLPGTNSVYAMEQAYEKANAYHGVLTITSIDGEGQRSVQAVREVWADKEGRYYVKELQGMEKGLITANNNKDKWQIKEKNNYISLYPPFPDKYSFTFEIGKEIQDIEGAAEVKEKTEDTVGGVQAILYKITPKGGDIYSLWIDKRTGIPLKKQTAMVNGIAYEFSYTNMDYIDKIPEKYLTYGDLSGYVVNREDNWQICATLEEAENLLGVTSKLPDVSDTSYNLMEISANTKDKAIKAYYGLEGKDEKVAVIEKSAIADENAKAITGLIGSVKAEITTNPADAGIEVSGTAGSITTENFGQKTGITSVRWQQEGIEYQVIGNGSMDEINVFVKALSGNKAVLTKSDEDTPQVKVNYDIKEEEQTQKGVDAGHQPWRLDPTFVAQVFTSLLISPEGITGAYPIPYKDFKIIKNNGSSMVIGVNNKKSPASKVYVKQLVRQDSTGIWTVVGYDKNKYYKKK